MASSTISYVWRDTGATQGFRSGVSLHSHTNQSTETLAHLANFGSKLPWMRPLMARLERRSAANHGMPVNYAAAYWTPPMTPKLAFDLESGQIEALDLEAMVSLSDHDNIKAPMLLQAVAHGRQIPISVEWTAPYGDAVVPPGHPQPAQRASHRMDGDFWRITPLIPGEERLTEILVALNEEPDVLVVFNHPLWDLYMVGREKHDFLVNEFLQKNGAYLHALELNGLRDWDENRAVRWLAEEWDMLLISGGDRHGVEANANINLTNATSFAEFVHEVRREKKSKLLFMAQYAEPWKHRILQSAIDAVRDYPEFPAGVADLGRTGVSPRWERRGSAADANCGPTVRRRGS